MTHLAGEVEELARHTDEGVVAVLDQDVHLQGPEPVRPERAVDATETFRIVALPVNPQTHMVLIDEFLVKKCLKKVNEKISILKRLLRGLLNLNSTSIFQTMFDLFRKRGKLSQKHF